MVNERPHRPFPHSLLTSRQRYALLPATSTSTASAKDTLAVDCWARP